VSLRPETNGSGNGTPNGRLVVDLNLPTNDDFGDYVRRALTP
jgi:hypothetical protein